jgi:sarcosine oxidase
MASPDRVVIVGAGLSGAAAAWSLSQRGVPVVVFEQFEPGHRRGSSHGSARIVRRAYGDELYVSLTGQAFELWRELETVSGVALLRMLGGLDFGAHRDVPRVATLLGDAGVPHEVMPAAQAAARWPGMEFEGDVLFHPQAGTVDAEQAVATMLAQAAVAGAEVRHSTPVASVTGDRVVLDDATAIAARCVVVAAGGWLAPLLAGTVPLPPLTVTQQQVFHFPRLDPSAPPWPSVIHDASGHAVYHLAGGRDGGPGDDRKLAHHGSDQATTAAGRDGRIDPAARARVTDYVRRWLPGLEATPGGETTCLYTETPSEDFVLDRAGDLVICSPCSGHGAKFAPLIGEFVADLVTGAASPVPDRFRLAAHTRGPGAGVSL